MNEEDKNINKLLMIEKAVNEMIAVREQIAELKEWEARRQLMMKRFQDSEKKFKTLVDNLPQKMYMKDKSSVYAFCNEKYAADLK